MLTHHQIYSYPLIFLLILAGLLLPAAATAAPPYQTPAPSPVEEYIYTVQPGDTLIAIALRHNLRLTDIILANNLLSPGLIFPGQQLNLPGAWPRPTPVLRQPTPLPAPPQPATAYQHIVQPNETSHSISQQYNLSLTDLMLANPGVNLDAPVIGQVLTIPTTSPGAANNQPPLFTAVQLSEPTIMQGRTLIVTATLAQPAQLSGMFEGQPLLFNNSNSGQQWAITAIHALLAPGDYPLIVTATLPDGRTVDHTTIVSVTEGPYGQENIQLDTTRSQLLEAELLAQERELLVSRWTQLTPRPYWQGSFWYPVTLDDLRITSYFGTRRTYNNSAELSFHSGTDFGGSGTPIYAPAAGTVVLAERLTVRGNAVLIDHGLGLYSGYWHQSQLAVEAGQTVQQGQLLGYIGNTGLVTGPHLHWEMRLNGIAVNPLQWVREEIP